MAPKKNAENDGSPSGKVNRLSIPLKADGVSIDYEQMRPSTRDKFKAAVDSTPEIIQLLDPQGAAAEGIGVADEAIPDLFSGITMENIRSGLDLLAGINAKVFAMMAGRFVKHPALRDDKGRPVPMQFDADLVSNCFKMTEAQHAELDPRVLRIAQKHGNVLPEWFKKHMDIYMAASMFLKYQGENAIKVIQAQGAVDMQAIRQRQAQQARPTNGRAAPQETGPVPIRITEVSPTGEGASA